MRRGPCDQRKTGETERSARRSGPVITPEITTSADTKTPAKRDLTTYYQGSEVAMQRLPGYDEALQCGSAFMRIKLTFVPGVDTARYATLTPAQKAARKTLLLVAD